MFYSYRLSSLRRSPNDLRMLLNSARIDREDPLGVIRMRPSAISMMSIVKSSRPLPSRLDTLFNLPSISTNFLRVQLYFIQSRTSFPFAFYFISKNTISRSYSIASVIKRRASASISISSITQYCSKETQRLSNSSRKATNSSIISSIVS